MSKRETIVTVANVKEITGVHYTVNHTGKMTGMQSLSTSCLDNPYCRMYAKDPEKICSKCYAERQMNCYKSMQNCLAKNTEILTTKRLSYEEIPFLNAAMFRFESFGDIQNETQVINYLNICHKNSHVNFALWTKNPAILDTVFGEIGEDKPKNLQIVLSSHFVNQQAAIEPWWFVDKVFTVYTKEYAEEHNIDINCGARLCIACRRCYLDNDITYINELLK